MLGEAKFWARVKKTPSCWLWLGTQTKHYGSFYPGSTQPGSYPTVYAHRYSYELHIGPIPLKHDIDHLCRTPLCVNPDHLEAVTHRVNLLRGETFAARYAAQTHCKHGHELKGANLVPDRRGRRLCRTCHNTRRRAAYHDRRAVEASA